MSLPDNSSTSSAPEANSGPSAAGVCAAPELLDSAPNSQHSNVHVNHGIPSEPVAPLTPGMAALHEPKQQTIRMQGLNGNGSSRPIIREDKKAVDIPSDSFPLESKVALSAKAPSNGSSSNGSHVLNGSAALVSALTNGSSHSHGHDFPQDSSDSSQGGAPTVTLRYSDAKVRSRVRAALDVLSILKQEVIRHLFGFDGHGPRTHAEVAQILSSALSAPQRWVIARERGIQPEQVRISAEEVKMLEVQALRDVRPSRSRMSEEAPDPLLNPLFTGNYEPSNN